MPSSKDIRYAARTVIWDEEQDVIAVIEVKDGAYHKIPGGGLEGEESLKEAVAREAMEEAGCEVEIIDRIGEIEFEFPDVPGRFNHSVCFLARKQKEYPSPCFTDEEKSKKFRLIWVTLDQAIELFEELATDHPFEIAMNNRDLEFVKKAKEYITLRKVCPQYYLQKI